MNHDDLVAAFEDCLAPAYRLSPDLAEGRVTVRLDADILQTPLIAIPDCHLADGSDGDEFLNGDPRNVTRLEAVLRAVKAVLTDHPETCAVQLGDWFDVWRASGGDVSDTNYGVIQNAAIYKTILDLDAEIGLAHIIGNHDASFLNALPDLRAAQPDSFRLGAWLMPSVYAMHGHQTDVRPPKNSDFDQFIDATATALARFIPGVRMFEEFIDSELNVGTAINTAILRALGVIHRDPPPVARPADTRTGSPDPTAPFAVRENADVLARLACKIASLTDGVPPRLLVVGHSHNPCVAWSDVSGRAVTIVDAGACVFSRCNVLLGAGDRMTVFDVVA